MYKKTIKYTSFIYQLLCLKQFLATVHLWCIPIDNEVSLKEVPLARSNLITD